MFDKLKQAREPNRQKPRTILVVDDELDVLRSTQMLLERFGFSCIVLPDAAHLAEVAASQKPDLIMQDILMPGLDVEALLAKLRTWPGVSTIPIILFSASEDLSERAAELDAAGYLRKPFAEQELRAVLERVLGPLPTPVPRQADKEPAATQALRDSHREAVQSYFHEFRNSLTAMASYAQFLLNSPNIHDPEREAAEELNRLLLEAEKRVAELRAKLSA